MKLGYALSSEERAPGELVEHALPRYFKQATASLTREDVADVVVCGSDIGERRAKIDEFADAGFDHVYVHQVGSDQEGFMRFYERSALSTVTA